MGPAGSQTLYMRRNSARENREIPRSPRSNGEHGRIGKADGHTPMMHDPGKSDRLVVPTKSPNNAEQSAAEVAEGRSLTKGNPSQQNTPRTQCRTSVLNALERVREVARKDRKARFTALLHHITIDRLRDAYLGLKRRAAAGVDGVTWQRYGEGLEDNLRDLHARLHRGAYRAKPSRRAYIPKADGRQRPLGIAAVEDKVVQAAVVEVMNAIYEVDFLGFSYGFRPGRNQHQALDALAVGLLRKKVSWVLDADIRGFFDAIDHGWLMKFVEHRIADQRVLRLIRKWLNAGVLEDGKWTESSLGTPQGATISPLLANLYLFYVLDLWVHEWRKKHAHGDVVIVRYADDFVVGFQHRNDAEAFLGALRERMQKFGLELHPEKTRLIEFGRFAAQARAKRGLPKPDTFSFLGFTHICGKSRAGKFLLLRHTISKRLRAKLLAIKTELRRRLHASTPEVGAWLRSVLRGYFAYHAVPTNIKALAALRYYVTRLWFRTLRRRSQRHRMTWQRMGAIARRWLPAPKILHTWPDERFDVTTQGKSRMQ